MRECRELDTQDEDSESARWGGTRGGERGGWAQTWIPLQPTEAEQRMDARTVSLARFLANAKGAATSGTGL